ncbi:hypothetical protein PHJA_000156400 [Phtheirospermum japonicum]|uniref:Uncharacterized protein n=1 Tax=Phtheirospermum japonicum TaxID=374723 RepID=A0A830AYY7_9LAMI|nr:hypothetical protein PHJA_000156400 [Phtheirospermum japonicum]
MGNAATGDMIPAVLENIESETNGAVRNSDVRDGTMSNGNPSLVGACLSNWQSFGTGGMSAENGDDPGVMNVVLENAAADNTDIGVEDEIFQHSVDQQDIVPQVLYADRVELFMRGPSRSFPSIKTWTTTLLKQRQKMEIDANGFGSGFPDERYKPSDEELRSCQPVIQDEDLGCEDGNKGSDVHLHADRFIAKARCNVHDGKPCGSSKLAQYCGADDEDEFWGDPERIALLEQMERDALMSEELKKKMNNGPSFSIGCTLNPVDASGVKRSDTTAAAVIDIHSTGIAARKTSRRRIARNSDVDCGEQNGGSGKGDIEEQRLISGGDRTITKKKASHLL